MEATITSGNLIKAMRKFAVPYLIACFLQTFYGMADLFITGQFNSAASVTAVSVGSQVMHMLTVIVIGLAMGTTVTISRSIGAKNKEDAAYFLGMSVLVFSVLAVISTILLIAMIPSIINILNTPVESVTATHDYLLICFAGIPFIVAYNVIGAIFRGLGDTKRPMIFVGIAGIINIGLDYILIGPGHLGATGAAIATVLAQACSVGMALVAMRRMDMGISLTRKHFKWSGVYIRKLLGIGTPIACQDGFIQISFLVITMIANSRGLEVATAVGIVEKIISFLFLVPSAMLSTVAAFAAQNAGARNHLRGRQALRNGLILCVGYGFIIWMLCQFIADEMVGLFVTNETNVVRFGGQYLRSYSIDAMIAGIHFCFSGYFSAYGKSMYSFVHNLISVLLVRIPGTYAASVLFPTTLYPMGLAAPFGSILSVVICLFLYYRVQKMIQTHSISL